MNKSKKRKKSECFLSISPHIRVLKRKYEEEEEEEEEEQVHRFDMEDKCWNMGVDVMNKSCCTVNFNGNRCYELIYKNRFNRLSLYT